MARLPQVSGPGSEASEAEVQPGARYTLMFESSSEAAAIYRYSSFALRLGVNPYAMPAPAAAPIREPLDEQTAERSAVVHATPPTVETAVSWRSRSARPPAAVKQPIVQRVSNAQPACTDTGDISCQG